MRVFITLVVFVMFVAGLYSMGLAFTHPEHIFAFFGAGLGLVSMAFALPIHLMKDQ